MGSPNDLVLDIKIDGNDLEAAKRMIQNVAPMMGFEVERAEILSNNMPEEPQLDTQRSNISTDMRDEIKNMIDARVKEQLNESLSNFDQVAEYMSVGGIR